MTDPLLAAQARLEAKRKELKLTPLPSGNEVGSQRLDGTCACGTPVSIDVPTLGGRPMPLARNWVPTCPQCQQDQDEKQAAETQRTHEAVKVARRTRLLGELKTPALFADCTLDSFQPHGSVEDQERQRDVVAFLRTYVERFPKVGALYLFRGAPGTGKGHLTHALAKAVVERHVVGAKVVKLHALITDLRASWSKGYSGPSDEQRLETYLSPALLIVDEVSEHAFFGQNIHQHLYSVLDSRLEALTPTILTSNEDDVTLAKVLRPALMNRLEGEGGIIECQWPSWRTKR